MHGEVSGSNLVTNCPPQPGSPWGSLCPHWCVLLSVVPPPASGRASSGQFAARASSSSFSTSHPSVACDTNKRGNLQLHHRVTTGRRKRLSAKTQTFQSCILEGSEDLWGKVRSVCFQRIQGSVRSGWRSRQATERLRVRVWLSRHWRQPLLRVACVTVDFYFRSWSWNHMYLFSAIVSWSRNLLKVFSQCCCP